MDYTLINFANDNIDKFYNKNILAALLLIITVFVVLITVHILMNIGILKPGDILANTIILTTLISCSIILVFSLKWWKDDFKNNIINNKAYYLRQEYKEPNDHKIEFIYNNKKINISNKVLVEITAKEYTYYKKGLILNNISDSTVIKHDNYKLILSEKMLKEIKEHIIEKIKETDKSSEKDIENYIEGYVTYIVVSNYNKSFTKSKYIDLKIENMEIDLKIENI